MILWLWIMAKISISEDRRKLIGEQYCSMEDTIYVGE